MSHLANAPRCVQLTRYRCFSTLHGNQSKRGVAQLLVATATRRCLRCKTVSIVPTGRHQFCRNKSSALIVGCILWSLRLAARCSELQEENVHMRPVLRACIPVLLRITGNNRAELAERTCERIIIAVSCMYEDVYQNASSSCAVLGNMRSSIHVYSLCLSKRARVLRELSESSIRQLLETGIRVHSFVCVHTIACILRTRILPENNTLYLVLLAAHSRQPVCLFFCKHSLSP